MISIVLPDSDGGPIAADMAAFLHAADHLLGHLLPVRKKAQHARGAVERACVGCVSHFKAPPAQRMRLERPSSQLLHPEFMP